MTMEKMRAFVMKKIGDAGVVEKPVPAAASREAVIKTTAALICTSDVHTLEGGIGEREDLTLGHEAVGVIHELGSDVKGLETGQRVAVNAITPCYRCTNCMRGCTSQCTELLGGFKFANMRDGNLAGYFLVNDAEANLAPIPDDVSDEEAAYCCDMMSTGFMGAENANIPMGGTVAVFAQGPVGLMATVGARLQGAGLVIAVETVDSRKELAREYGADEVLDFRKVDPVEQILELTGGEGVDSAIEALGEQSTFEACVKATRPGGTISNTGYYSKGDYVKIPRLEWGLGMGEKNINTGLCPGGRVRMARLMRLIRRRRVDPTKMTTHTFSFDEVDKAFEMMKDKKDNIIKPLITFD